MIRVPVGSFCNYEHLKGFVDAKTKSGSKKPRPARKKDSIGEQHRLTQPVFNKMRVLEELLWFKERNLEPLCISCQKPIGGDRWSCGHFKTVGGNGHLAYDRKNTYLQHLVRCNKHLSGDIGGAHTGIGYIKGLAIRFGQGEADKIIAHCESSKGWVPRDWQEIKERRLEWRKEIKRLSEILEDCVTTSA